MLLRASGEFHGEAMGLDAINGAGLGDCGIPHAELLVRFAEAAARRDDAALEPARAAVLDALGESALVDCAAVTAVFDAVVRIADATGIPLEDYKREISQELRADLGIDAYPAH